MAIRPLNSIAGFSTGDPAITVIQANGDVTTVNLTANGISNLGNVGNVHIEGGNSGQFLKTDGNGNLQWDDVGNITSNTAAPMPYFIAANTSFIVNEFKQGLYAQPIEIDGELVVDGMLIEISDTVQSSDNQILFDFNGVPTGNAGFEFQYWDGNLNVPGNINANGSIIPGVDDVYDLGRANRRWRNGYFGGNTLYLDSASISVDANGYVVITNSIGGQFIVEGNTVSGTAEIENGTSNVRVYENSNIAMTVNGTANVMLITTSGAVVTGNVDTTGIKTDNIYHANGSPWNFGQDPGGGNTEIQFNDSDNFGGSAALTFNKTSNVLTLIGNVAASGVKTDNLYYANGTPYNLGQDPGGSNTQIQFNNNGVFGATANFTFNTDTNVLTVNGAANISGNLSAGNITGGNLLSANYLISNSGCVTIGVGHIAVSAGTGGIFNSSVNDINLGLSANVSIGSTTGNTTIRGNLIANNNITVAGNISANLITGTLTTASQSNITTVGTLGNLSVIGNITSNNSSANTLTTNSVISKRSAISATTLTVIDSFAANAYRTAKYVVSSQSDIGYESLEVLLIHNDINSYVTVYGAINDGGGNTVTMSTGINSGNVELRATGLGANTIINLIGTYVPN